MSRWKLFGKSKKQPQPTIKEIDIPMFEDDEPIKPEQETPMIKEDLQEEPVTEYKETLYSSDHPEHKKTSGKRWESTTTIERNIDTLDKKTASTKTSGSSEVINEKVDQLLSKKGVKLTSKTAQKKSDIPEGYVAKKNKRTGLTYYTKE